MADTITVMGNIATVPERGNTTTGIPTLNFRMATNHRRPDGAGGWIDAGTNWFEIKTYRRLAENAAASLTKGDGVIVVGRLKLRTWEGKDGKRGTSVEIEAESVGLDLRRGHSAHPRSTLAAPRAGAEGADDPAGAPELSAVPAGASMGAADDWPAAGDGQTPF